ncbi:MAG: phage tail protein [Candidatus Diapherotrites archaeon]|nr:phage tail protein [Candidatus Diapherotrites archaeon]
MKKNFKILAGIFLLLFLAGVFALGDSYVGLQTQDNSFMMSVFISSLQEIIPGAIHTTALIQPTQISGLGFETLESGERTTTPLTVTKLATPFALRASNQTNYTQDIIRRDDKAVWDWAMKSLNEGSSNEIKRSIEVKIENDDITENKTYTLTNAFPKSWKLSTFTKGQEDPLTETYEFEYEGIQLWQFSRGGN